MHIQDTANLLIVRGISESMPVPELELMHRYTAYTYLTMSNNPILVSLWKGVVPDHAFRNPFLLQGLLAVAA